jgi:hypothetical protein
MFNLIPIFILFPSSIFNAFPHKLSIFQSFISKKKFNIGSSIIGIWIVKNIFKLIEVNNAPFVIAYMIVYF